MYGRNISTFDLRAAAQRYRPTSTRWRLAAIALRSTALVALTTPTPPSDRFTLRVGPSGFGTESPELAILNAAHTALIVPDFVNIIR